MLLVMGKFMLFIVFYIWGFNLLDNNNKIVGKMFFELFNF